ncbi:transmembrane protein [Kwoniella mangroviensis CBS 8886]|nr:transmembrane protein [Kwoniella mangroviensis CBS 8886]
MSTPPPPSYSSPILPPSASPSSNNSLHKQYPQPPNSTIINIDSTPSGTSSAIPNHMKSLPLSRTNSNTSSLAEEGELFDDPLTSPGTPDDVGDRADENTGLLSNTKKAKWYKGPYFITAIKFSILFTIFTIVVVITFYFGMPKLDKEDRGLVKLPRSFKDLQDLNTLFQKYKKLYPLRILACAVVTYLFVQTFTLPGSMYISILFGAAYGIMYGLVLSCLCDAFGSLLCYTLSSLLAPPLLTMPFYRARVETWRTKIMGDPKKGKKVTWDSIFAFLLVLRIAPFPPHWVANFVAPHLGIGMFMFWSSCFIGIAPVSVIHVTIGSSLDSMTSAADFHILSLRNILGLLAVVVAVLIPVGLKRVFKKDLGDLGEAEEIFNDTDRRNDRDIQVPPIEGSEIGGRRYHAIDSGVVLSWPSTGGNGENMGNKLIKKGKGRALEIIHDEDEEEEEDGFYDEDGEDEWERYEGETATGASTSNSNITSGQASPNAESNTTPTPTPDVSEAGENGSDAQPQPQPQYQYEVYDPSGQIDSVRFNPTRTRSRSNSKLSQNGGIGVATRPKGYSRSNTNTSNRFRNYGAVEEESAPLVNGNEI